MAIKKKIIANLVPYNSLEPLSSYFILLSCSPTSNQAFQKSRSYIYLYSHSFKSLFISMNPPLEASILLISILLCASQPCTQQCIDVSEHLCSICYSSCGNQSIEFLNCTQSRGGNKSQYTQTDCLQKCCAEQFIDDSQFSLENIKQCQSNIVNKSKVGLIFGITLSLVSLTIFFVVVGIGWFRYGQFCYLFKKIFKSCQSCCCLGSDQRQPRNKQAETNAPTNKNLSHQGQGPDFKYFCIQLEQCSICLQVNVNCTTPCQHSFHVTCLNEWLKRTMCCPNCRNKSVNPIKVECKRCLKNCIEYNLPKGFEYGWNKCKSCQRA